MGLIDIELAAFSHKRRKRIFDHLGSTIKTSLVELVPRMRGQKLMKRTDRTQRSFQNGEKHSWTSLHYFQHGGESVFGDDEVRIGNGIFVCEMACAAGSLPVTSTDSA